MDCAAGRCGCQMPPAHCSRRQRCAPCPPRSLLQAKAKSGASVPIPSGFIGPFVEAAEGGIKSATLRDSFIATAAAGAEPHEKTGQEVKEIMGRLKEAIIKRAPGHKVREGGGQPRGGAAAALRVPTASKTSQQLLARPPAQAPTLCVVWSPCCYPLLLPAAAAAAAAVCGRLVLRGRQGLHRGGEVRDCAAEHGTRVQLPGTHLAALPGLHCPALPGMLFPASPGLPLCMLACQAGSPGARAMSSTLCRVAMRVQVCTKRMWGAWKNTPGCPVRFFENGDQAMCVTGAKVGAVAQLFPDLKGVLYIDACPLVASPNSGGPDLPPGVKEEVRRCPGEGGGGIRMPAPRGGAAASSATAWAAPAAN